MMAVLVPRLDAGAVARFQDLVAGIGDMHYFAMRHIDALVLPGVPVMRAGPDVRRGP